MKKSQKGSVAVIVLVIIIVLLIIGGWFSYKYLTTPIFSCWPYCPNMTDQDREDINESAQEAENSTNWKTYTNTKNGYELKYPPTWKIKENPDSSVAIYNPEKQGKLDTDQPSEFFGISLNQTPCQLKDWNLGFGAVYYKDACISTNSKAQISMVAFSEQTKVTEDSILDTIKFISPTNSKVGYNGSGIGYAGISKGGALCADCTIAVIYPNGGEKLTGGSTIKIEWITKPEYFNKPVNIALLGKTETTTTIIAKNVPNTGSYIWTIPTSTIPFSYVIHVSIPDVNGVDAIDNPNSDRSNSPFSINPVWQKYSGTDFEFMYPPLVSLKQEGGLVSLQHSLPYKHQSPCDFVGDLPPLEKLTDFDVSFTVSNKNLEGTKKDNFVWSFDDFQAGSVKGLKGESGIEGCGLYTYIFPISENKSLVVKRSYITEFKPIISDYQTYLNLPGIITPNQEEDYFSKILSSLKIK